MLLCFWTCKRVLITVKGYRQQRTENDESMLNGKNFVLSIISHSMVRMKCGVSTADIL